jgi:hypothetical protein
MRGRILTLAILIMVASSQLFGQDTTSAQFQKTESTTYEDAMAIGEAVILVPLAVGTTIISVVPPNGGVLVRDGKANGVLSFETGIGFGEKIELKRFSDIRFTAGFTHVFTQAQKDYIRFEAKKDFHLGFVDRREIFLFGISPAAGMFTEFPSTGYSIGVSTWLMTPWLSYFGFIPQHTFGITYRYNKYLSGKYSHEITAGMSAAFTWGW